LRGGYFTRIKVYFNTVKKRRLMTVPEERDSTGSGDDGKTVSADSVADGNESLISARQVVAGNKTATDTEKESQEKRVGFELDDDAENGEKETKPEDAALLSIEVSQQTGWMPDGGWGWGVVAGGVIVHVYVGKLLS
jgi:hypothetical protein